MQFRKKVPGHVAGTSALPPPTIGHDQMVRTAGLTIEVRPSHIPFARA